MHVAIDHNCLIALEKGEATAASLRQSAAAHERGRITLCVPAMSASERLQSRTYLGNLAALRERVGRLSRRGLEILAPMGFCGVTYYDCCIYGDDSMVALAEQIHEVLHPGVALRWQDYAHANSLDPETAMAANPPAIRKWRNRLCDTVSLWCHIHYRCDHYVTSDRNFHKATKKRELAQLGASSILRPHDALHLGL